MATKRSKAQQPVDTWLTDPQDLPRADIDLRDKTASRQKLYRVMIFSVMFGLFPLSLLANMAMMPKVLDFSTAAVAAPERLNSETKSAAMLSVTKWLAQTPSPLPGGSLLSWDGVDIQAEPSITVDKNNNQTVEKQGLQLHHMTVVSPTGAVFNTTVQVGYSKVRGAQVIGAPTLIPRAPDDASVWPNLQSWPNLTKTAATEQMTQAAKSWVEAFTSADPEKLHHTVADASTDHSYVPLRGVTPSDVRIEDVASRAPSDTETKPSEVVARISFAVKWDGQNVSGTATPSRVAYDVLMQKADTGSPVIVAWGGAGTGESLTAYANAVDRKLTSEGIGDAVPKPTASAAAPAPKPAAPKAEPVPTIGTLVPPASSTAGK